MSDYSNSPAKSWRVALKGSFFALQYPLANIYRMHPSDFLDLLLHGIMWVTWVMKLFVSQSARVGFFNFAEGLAKRGMFLDCEDVGVGS